MKRIVQRLTLFMALFLVPWVTQGQSFSDYALTTGVDATKWVTLDNPTTVSINNGDDTYSGLNPIGFTFNFAGVGYTQWSINSNGRMRLGNTAISNEYSSQPFSTTNAGNNTPKLAFYGGDLYFYAANSYVHYQLFGSTGNHKLVVEYSWGSSATATPSIVQIQLTESGEITYVYSDTHGSTKTSGQIGMSNSSSEIFLLNNSHVANHLTAGTTSSTLSSSFNWPGDWRYYTFVLPTCFAPTLGDFTEITTGSAKANWTASALAETQYQYILKRQTAGAPTDAEWAAVAPYTGTNVVLNGLDAYEYYTLYIRSYCAVDDQSPVVSASFNTNPFLPEEVIVANGTATNSYVPLYGNWADAVQRSQSIYPASMLTALQGKTINQLKYYTTGSYDYTGNWKVYITTTTETNFASANFIDVDENALIFEASPLVVSEGEMLITLSTPFTYTDGNLLIQFVHDVAGGYNSRSFYGISSTNSSIYNYGTNAPSQQSFLPKVDFLCAPPVTPAITAAPSEPIVSDITATTAKASWTAAEGANRYQYIVVPLGSNYSWNSTAVKNTSSNTNNNITGLTGYEFYTLHVRALIPNATPIEYSATVSTNFMSAVSCTGSYTHSVQSTYGTGTSTSYYTPFASNTGSSYANGASWQIFKASELFDDENLYIGYAGQIKGFAWYYASNNNASVPIKVYMKSTAKSSFDSATDTISRADMTLVFNGTQTFYANSFNEIKLTTPFNYTADSNIAILVVRESGALSQAMNFRYSSVAGTSIYRYGSDATLANGSTGYRNITRFTICADEPTCYAVKKVFVSDTTANGITVHWKMNLENDTATTKYQVIAVAAGTKAEDIDWNYASLISAKDSIKNGDTLSVVIDTLNEYTQYDVYVRAYNSATDVSKAMSTTFQTSITCPVDAVDNMHSVYHQFAVGNGSSSDSYVPFYSNAGAAYKRGASWQLFTWNQLRNAGNLYQGQIGYPGVINGMSWYYNNTTADTLPVKIYMAMTSKTALAVADTALFKADNMTLVLDDTVIFNQGWNEMHLSTPFAYNGDSNLVIMVYRDSILDNTLNFRENSVSGAAVVAYGAATGNMTAETYSYRNQTRFTVCDYEPNVYPASYMWVVDSAITDTSVTINWLASLKAEDTVFGEKAYQVTVARFDSIVDWSIAATIVVDSANLLVDTAANGDTNFFYYSFTFDTLTPYTDYQFYVRAIDTADAGIDSVHSDSLYRFAMTALQCDNAQRFAYDGGAYNTTNTPIYSGSANFGATWSIYTRSEIKESTDAHVYPATIEGMAWEYVGTDKRNAAFQIYMGHTSKSTLTSTDTIFDGMTLVYDGTTQFRNRPDDDWNEIRFDTPFQYNGDSNLLVLVRRVTGIYENMYFTYTNEGANRFLYTYGSYTDAPMATRTVSSYRPSTRFSLCYDLPTCYPIDSIKVSGAQFGTSPVLTWIRDLSTANTFEVVYDTFNVLDSAIAHCVPSVIVTDTPRVVLTGLEADHVYYAWVRAICGVDDTSRWLASPEFSTGCSARTLPYDITFDQGSVDSTSLLCWQMSGYGYQGLSTAAHRNGVNSFIMYASDDRNYAVLPQFNGQLNDCEVKLYIRRESASYLTDTFQIGYLTNVDDYSTFVPYMEWTGNAVDFEPLTASFKGTGVPNDVFLAFHVTGHSNYGFYIDDIHIDIAQSHAYKTIVQTTCIDHRTHNYVWMNNGVQFEDLDLSEFVDSPDGTIQMFSHLVQTPTGDTTYMLRLTINHNADSIMVVDTCDTYTWSVNTVTYTASSNDGSISYNVNTTANKCDSIVYLDLTINNTVITTLPATTECGTYTWGVNNVRTFVNEGTTTTTQLVYDTLQSISGCDSILKMSLTLRPVTYYTPENVHYCDSYTWSRNGQTYDSTGTYYYQTSTMDANGCPKVRVLNLTLDTTVRTTVTIDTCGTWDGTIRDAGNNIIATVSSPVTNTSTTNDITRTIVYTFEGGASTGCDSVVTYNVTVHPATQYHRYVTSNRDYMWDIYENGENSLLVTEDTVIYKTQLIQNLYIGNTYVLHFHKSTQDSNICGGSKPTIEYLAADGTMKNYTHTTAIAYDAFDNEGILVGDTVTLADGSKILFYVNVFEKPATVEQQILACDSLDFTYTRWGKTVTFKANTDFYDTLTTANNICDSVIHYTLKVGTKPATADTNKTMLATPLTGCDSITWNDTKYTADFYDTVTLQYTTGAAIGCDSTVIVNLIVNHSAKVLDTVEYCGEVAAATYNNHTLNAAWKNNDRRMVAVDSIFFDTIGTIAGTNYGSALATVNTCDSANVLTVIVHPLRIKYDTVLATGFWHSELKDTTFIIPSGASDTVFSDTAVAANSSLTNCDSVITWVTIGRPIYLTENITACGYYTWPRNDSTYYCLTAAEKAAHPTANFKQILGSVEVTTTATDPYKERSAEVVSDSTVASYTTDSTIATIDTTYNADSTVVTYDTTWTYTYSDTVWQYEYTTVWYKHIDSVKYWRHGELPTVKETNDSILLADNHGLDIYHQLDLFLNDATFIDTLIDNAEFYPISLALSQVDPISGNPGVVFFGVDSTNLDTTWVVNKVDTIYHFNYPVNAVTPGSCATFYNVVVKTYNDTINYYDTLCAYTDSYVWQTADGDTIYDFANGLNIFEQGNSSRNYEELDTLTLEEQFTRSAVANETSVYTTNSMKVTDATTVNRHVHVLNLYAKPMAYVTDAPKVCGGEYTWARNNQTYNNPGIYHFTDNTNYSCDVTFVLNLQTNVFVTEEVVCDSLRWHDSLYTVSTTIDSIIFANDSLYQADGEVTCPKYYSLHLTVNYRDIDTVLTAGAGLAANSKNIQFVKDTTIATGYPIDLTYWTLMDHNMAYNNAKVDAYRHDYTYGATAEGCDMIHREVLYHWTSFENRDTVVVFCDNDNAPWSLPGGRTPVKVFNKTNATGKDTIDVADDTKANLAYNITLKYGVITQVYDTLASCGESYTFINGTDTVAVFDTTGNYVISFVPANTSLVCPTIDYVNFTRFEIEFDTVTLRQSELPYTYNEHNIDTIINAAGQYDSLRWQAPFAQGIDSVRMTNLTVNVRDSYVDTLDTVLCHADTLMFATGNTYTQGQYTFFVTKNYTFTYGAFYGDTIAVLDSAIRVENGDTTADLNLALNIHVYNRHDIEFDTTVECAYYWPYAEQTFYFSGAYEHASLDYNGCPNTVRLNLTTTGSSLTIDTVLACTAGYTWNGTNYTTSGVYYDTLSNDTETGCMTIEGLVLTINPSYIEEEVLDTVRFCGRYIWERRTDLIVTSDTTIADTVTNALGCRYATYLPLKLDTTVTYLLTPVYAAECGSYVWDVTGDTLTATGVYYDTLSVIGGCDTVSVLNLTIGNATSTVVPVEVCGSYTFNGETYTEDVILLDTLQTTIGCDSIVVYAVTVNQNASTNFTAEACVSYTWNGVEYTTSGTYTDTMAAINGCDSVVTMNLTINQPVIATVNEVACGSYTYNGQTYIQSATIYDTLTTAAGCDSIVTVNITVNQYTVNTTDTAVCGSLTWNGETYSVSGIYSDTVNTGTSCEINTLVLMINQPIVSNSEVTACDSYDWNGTTYTVSGNYTVSGTAANGCDSTANLTLTINNSQATTISATACDGYDWNGATYANSGSYTMNYTGANGCDSIVTLNLTVNNSVKPTVDVRACDSYNWNGETYTVSGIYVSDTMTAANGCDSIVTLVLTINPSITVVQTATAETSYEWNGQTYTTSGSYEVTVPSNVTGCDSTTILNLTITGHPVVYYTVDVTIYNEQTNMPDTNVGYVHGAGTYPADTVVTLTAMAKPGYVFTRWSNDSRTPTIQLTLTNNVSLRAYFRPEIGIDDVDNNVTIYSADSKIIVKGAENRDINVYDVNGRCISTQLNAAETVEIPMSNTGVYLVKVGDAPAKRVLVVK